jgi:hypothetical protein
VKHSRVLLLLASLGLLGAPAFLAMVVLLPSAVLLGGLTGGVGTSIPVAATQGPVSAIPEQMLWLYVAAARSCPGLPWSVLAAIGTLESDNGLSNAPGVWSGSNFKGAQGPMQFEPATFQEYATVGPGGEIPPSPYNPPDAVFSAAKMLCANGASSPTGLPSAIFAYNHADWYVREVFVLAHAYQTAHTSLPAMSPGELRAPT